MPNNNGQDCLPMERYCQRAIESDRNRLADTKTINEPGKLTCPTMKLYCSRTELTHRI